MELALKTDTYTNGIEQRAQKWNGELAHMFKPFLTRVPGPSIRERTVFSTNSARKSEYPPGRE